MKIRQGFVSNSSSSSFIITNRTGQRLKFQDFLEEIYPILDRLNETHNEYSGDTLDTVIDRDKSEFNIGRLNPGSSISFEAEDNCGGLNLLLCYIPKKGQTESFNWERANDWDPKYRELMALSEEQDRVQQRRKNKKNQRIKRNSRSSPNRRR
jgi:hypothetical protein